MKPTTTHDKLAQEARFRAQIAPGLAEVKHRLNAYFDAQEARCEAMRATVKPSTVEWHLRGHRGARAFTFNALALWVRMEARGWGGKAKEDAWGALRDYLQSAIPGVGKRRIQAHHVQAWMDARLKPTPASGDYPADMGDHPAP
jgi:hypothetical protein